MIHIKLFKRKLSLLHDEITGIGMIGVPFSIAIRFPFLCTVTCAYCFNKFDGSTTNE